MTEKPYEFTHSLTRRIQRTPTTSIFYAQTTRTHTIIHTVSQQQSLEQQQQQQLRHQKYD